MLLALTNMIYKIMVDGYISYLSRLVTFIMTNLEF